VFISYLLLKLYIIIASELLSKLPSILPLHCQHVAILNDLLDVVCYLEMCLVDICGIHFSTTAQHRDCGHAAAEFVLFKVSRGDFILFVRCCCTQALKVKGAMPQLGRRWGAHLPLAAVEPVGG